MSQLLECEGVPRDLGRDQGRGRRDAVHAAVAGRSFARRAADRLGVGDVATRRWLRDVRRHFPHQGEWLEGLAGAAGVEDLALARAIRTELASDPYGLALAVESGDGLLVVRTAPPRPTPARSRPEGRFASIEVGSALLTSPWVGVNENGLALAVVGGAEATILCAAHAALLVRDCLERFDGVESALAWCLSRPAAPGASILLADADGDIAGVSLEGMERRVRRAEGGVLVLGGGSARRAAEVAKGVVAHLAPADLDRALAEALGPHEAARAIRVDVKQRSLRASADAPLFALA